jgi:hypothetical protein
MSCSQNIPVHFTEEFFAPESQPIGTVENREVERNFAVSLNMIGKLPTVNGGVKAGMTFNDRAAQLSSPSFPTG